MKLLKSECYSAEHTDEIRDEACRLRPVSPRRIVVIDKHEHLDSIQRTSP
jgi:hypothetical protein